MTRTAEAILIDLNTVKAQWRGYNAGLNEGGEGYNPHSAPLRTLQAEYDAAHEAEVHAAYQARLDAEDAEWTKDVTIARRAEWNAWVKSQGKTIAPAHMATHCQDVGYDMLTLKRQITRHGL